jgi:2-polyprenyl-3-methyl-5-hydroxy-6-metoxy-1,4-benzoquinol methylase
MSGMISMLWVKLKKPLYRWYKDILYVRSNALDGLVPTEYIIPDRAFYYGRQLRFVDGIKMESAPGTYETILSELKKLISKDTTILDYGCGIHQSKYMRSLYGDRVSSADVLDFDIDNFYKINTADSSLPLPDKSFSISIASEVIEHVFSPFILLDELIRVSREYIIISTPNPASLKSRSLFSQTGFLHWFGPENWSYHITPVFYWQIEKYLKEKNVSYTRFSNHAFFGLKGDDIEYAEALIYIIDVRTIQ